MANEKNIDLAGLSVFKEECDEEYAPNAAIQHNVVQNLTDAQKVRALNNMIGKEYAPADFSGLGKKVFTKNIQTVGGVYKNIMTQAFFEDEQGSPITNTVFVIQYDFILGEDITIPANCVLEFDGGSISGGNITCNNALFVGNVTVDNVVFTDSCSNDEIFTSWFLSVNTSIFKNIVEVFGKGKTININTDITIDNSPIDGMYKNVIDLYSNTKLKGDTVHTIVVQNNNEHYGFNAVFGNAITNTDINDISFENIILRLSDYIAYSHSLAFIKLYKPDSSHVNNITVRNCAVEDAACLVYALKTRTTPTTDRTVNNLVIENCKAINVTWCGCTLDAKNAVVRNCYFKGHSSESYDGISIHSGINIVVENNTFERFSKTAGILFNIRNSPENGCGSSSIIIRNNIVSDCSSSRSCQIATAVSEGVDEPMYGVSDVSIIGNDFYNCQGLMITASASATQAPSDIKICDNILCGLYFATSVNNYIKKVLVNNNIINGSFYVSTVRDSVVTNNICTVPEGKTKGFMYSSSSMLIGNSITLEGSNDVFNIKNNYYISFSDNSIVGKTTISDNIFYKVLSNMFRGIVEITYDQTSAVSRAVIQNNLFGNNSTFNGRAFIDMELKSNRTKTLYTYDDGGGNANNIVGDIVINVNNATKHIQRCTVAGKPGTFATIVE